MGPTWLSFFFSSRRRHTRCSRDWSSDVCSSDLPSCHWLQPVAGPPATACRGRPPFRSWRRPRNPFFYQFAERTDTLAAFSRISGSCDRQPRSKGLLGGSAVVYRKWRVVGPGSHEADLDDRLRAGDEERGGWHDRFSSFHSSRSSPRYSDHSLHPARDFFFCCLARHAALAPRTAGLPARRRASGRDRFAHGRTLRCFYHADSETHARGSFPTSGCHLGRNHR